MADPQLYAVTDGQVKACQAADSEPAAARLYAQASTPPGVVFLTRAIEGRPGAYALSVRRTDGGHGYLTRIVTLTLKPTGSALSGGTSS